MASNFNIRVEGLDTSLQKLANLATQNKTMVKQAINETAINIERKAKENLASLPFKDSAGGLAQSAYVLYDPDGYGTSVGFNAFYAPFVEYGTGTEVDVPQGFEAYAMQFKRGDSVNIPVMPYFHPAINSELDNLKRKLERSMRP